MKLETVLETVTVTLADDQTALATLRTTPEPVVSPEAAKPLDQAATTTLAKTPDQEPVVSPEAPDPYVAKITEEVLKLERESNTREWHIPEIVSGLLSKEADRVKDLAKYQLNVLFQYKSRALTTLLKKDPHNASESVLLVLRAHAAQHDLRNLLEANKQCVSFLLIPLNENFLASLSAAVETIRADNYKLMVCAGKYQFEQREDEAKETWSKLKNHLTKVEGAVCCLKMAFEMALRALSALEKSVQSSPDSASDSASSSCEKLRADFLGALTSFYQPLLSLENTEELEKMLETVEVRIKSLVTGYSPATINKLAEAYKPIFQWLHKKYVEKGQDLFRELLQAAHVHREAHKLRKYQKTHPSDSIYKLAGETKNSAQTASATQSELSLPGPSTEQHSTSDPFATSHGDDLFNWIANDECESDLLARYLSNDTADPTSEAVFQEDDLPTDLIGDVDLNLASAAVQEDNLPADLIGDVDLNLATAAVQEDDLPTDLIDNVDLNLASAAFQEDNLPADLIGDVDLNLASAAVQEDDLPADLIDNVDPNLATAAVQEVDQTFAERRSKQPAKRRYSDHDYAAEAPPAVGSQKANKRARANSTPTVPFRIQSGFFSTSLLQKTQQVVTETAADKESKERMTI